MALVTFSHAKTVLFAPAAGPGVGGGHVMRCLTLAEALVGRGARCAFSVNAEGAALADRFGGGAFRMHLDGVAAALASEAFDVLLLDDYAFNVEQEEGLQRAVKRLVVIDDLADRPHLADLLIDPGYGRTDADYVAFLPADAIRLTGPVYSLVKPAFARLRAKALAKPVPETPRSLFISFGLSDIDGIAARGVAAVRGLLPEIRIDLALASDAASASTLSARAEIDLNLHLHLDAENVAELMANADLAVGAGGSSTWERACFGLPTLAVIVAENQRSGIQALAAQGMLLAVDMRATNFESAFSDALTALGRQALRADLRARSSKLCDGLGAGRIADTILRL